MSLSTDHVKPWYRSKTVWFNVLGVAVVIGKLLGFSLFQLDPTLEAGVLAVFNLILRFATRVPIH